MEVAGRRRVRRRMAHDPDAAHELAAASEDGRLRGMLRGADETTSTNGTPAMHALKRCVRTWSQCSWGLGPGAGRKQWCTWFANGLLEIAMSITR